MKCLALAVTLLSLELTHGDAPSNGLQIPNVTSDCSVGELMAAITQRLSSPMAPMRLQPFMNRCYREIRETEALISQLADQAEESSPPP